MTKSLLVFSQNEFYIRLHGVQTKMEDYNMDVMVIHSPENIFYLTGYQSAGYHMYLSLVIPLTGNPMLIIRNGELSNVHNSSWLLDDQILTYDDDKNPVNLTADVILEQNITSGKIGLEKNSWFLTVQCYEKLSEKLLNCNLIDAKGIIENLRVIKSNNEIKYIKEACFIADQSIQAGLNDIKCGMNEDSIAKSMFSKMIESGGEHVGMEPFVSSGHRTGNMHSAWGHKNIYDGDTVLLEIAGARNRYHGGVMRTAFVGTVPNKIKEMSEVCIESLNAAIDTIKPGVTAGEVDEACRGVIEKAGYYDQFRKRTGYSMGIAFAPDWGEGHIMSLQRNNHSVLKAGMVFHIPPALREANKFGVGFSETILVTEKGCEVLTMLPRELTLVSI